MDQKQFEADELRYDAVLRNLELIGIELRSDHGNDFLGALRFTQATCDQRQ